MRLAADGDFDDFYPLTFVAGIYGMNFNKYPPWNMPELNWYWGYPLCLAGMGWQVGLVIFFWPAAGLRIFRRLRMIPSLTSGRTAIRDKLDLGVGAGGHQIS